MPKWLKYFDQMPVMQKYEHKDGDLKKALLARKKAETKKKP